MSRLSALAAVGLANLVVLGVRDGVELGNLAGFGVLLVALGDTGTETWELREVAGALNIERRLRPAPEISQVGISPSPTEVTMVGTSARFLMFFWPSLFLRLAGEAAMMPAKRATRRILI